VSLHAVVPSARSADSYALRMIAALDRAMGTATALHRLPGRHPQLDPSTIFAAELLLSRLPDGAVALIDGTTLPTLAAALPLDDRRLRLVALVERLRWTEPGLSAEEAAAHRHIEQGALALMRVIVAPTAAVAAEVIALGVAPDSVLRATADETGARALLARLADVAGLATADASAPL
jgi:hypothetical protein